MANETDVTENVKRRDTNHEKIERERESAEHVRTKMRTITIHDEAIRSNPFRNAVNPFKHLCIFK